MNKLTPSPASALLLHSCCAPCTTFVYQELLKENLVVYSLFYNPNIQPQEEYERRRKTMEEYAGKVGLNVIFAENDVCLQPNDCESCCRVRFTKTAQIAQEKEFEYFSTTLLISPYQNHELLKKIGHDTAAKYGVKFFYRDFRSGFRESQKTAKAMGLYRQKYCGCQN
ncbi:MAG: epoxyqueuosine reductase QueH [Candidatus Margulisbacteria bacterium]|nr:epoxyqueuosine reductase QueH [Candidatus Margulisiibacteriota bacterium]